MHQLDFDDIELSNTLALQPGRTAYIDECGNFGFDFSKEGTSPYYVVCAVIVKNEHISKLEEAIEKIRLRNFQTQEMKSNLIGGKHDRRIKVLTELLALDFSLILLIADKQLFTKNSALTIFQDSFVKFLHQKLYNEMYNAFPKLTIIEDEYSTTEFQHDYRKYVIAHRQNLNLFDEYDFDYRDSRFCPIVQVADIIAGSITQRLLDSNAPDALRIFQGRITGQVNFPNKYLPFLNGTIKDDKYDSIIYSLATHCAEKYIDKHVLKTEQDERLRVMFLKHLLFVVRNISSSKFVSSDEIVNFLSSLSECKIWKNYLYRRIIAPLRDDNVIIASGSQGYKIPVCIDDIVAYVHQTDGVVSPMLNRVQKCRELLLKQTDGDLDIFNDQALVAYKRYFGEL